MPGKTSDGEEVGSFQCKRCNEESAVALIRSERLGRNCLSRYISTKVVKRMETFKVRKSSQSSPSKLLISFSSGISSAVLLDILNRHLETQLKRQPRIGYKLVVFFIDMSEVDPLSPPPAVLDAFRRKYPLHEFIARPLSDILKTASDIGVLFSDLAQHQDGLDGTIKSDQEVMEAVIKGATSATARIDIINILKMRLVAKTAKENGCEAVLWGDSTTRLAEKTLAATAKGKGIAIPLLLADGPSPYGIDFRYPMGDVLRSEILSFKDYIIPELSDICTTPKTPTRISASAKNTTIDDLMTQYFESVEAGYPSVISNVVKTSSKLDPSSLRDSDSYCVFCRLPGDLQAGADLCYDCARSLPSYKENS